MALLPREAPDRGLLRHADDEPPGGPEDADEAETAAAAKLPPVLADPMKALKSDKPEARAEAAAILLIKYRSYPALATETEAVAIDAAESKLILKGLAEADWRYQAPRSPVAYGPLPHLAFRHLGLNEKDGWVPPVVAPPQPGMLPVDPGVIIGDAFGQWFDGPGKNYVIKKIVTKKTNK